MNDPIPMTGRPSDPDLGPHLDQLAAALTSVDAVDADRVILVLLRAVPRADHAGLTLLRDGRAPTTIASSSEVPRALDLLQHQTQEGPFIDAESGHGIVVVDDFGSDPRWREFGARAATTANVRSMLSIRLALGGSDRARLSLYAGGPGAFDEADATATSRFAPFAALAAGAHLRAADVDNLTAALETSRQIGTAVGIVMARYRMTSDEAFALLRRASMDLNRKVHDLAAEVELTGLVPGHRSTPPVG